METNVSYTLVGAFVITLITFIVLAVIWLSSGFSFIQYSVYAVYMQESVSGLHMESPVEFNGVDVGSVSSIQLEPKNPEMVKILLKVKKSTPISQATVATLNTRGLTGITYMSLKDKGTDLRPLVALKGEKYPVIKTSPSLFMRLDTMIRKFSSNFQEISESIHNLLNKENLKEFATILVNLRILSITLAENSKKLDAIFANTARASAQMTPLLHSSANVMNTIENQTLPMTYNLLSNLNEASQNIAAMSVELKQNPSVLIRGTSPVPLGPGETK